MPSEFAVNHAPFRYQPFTDNRVHVVKPGDTLWHVAAWYFAPFPRACGYWWVLADFQPQPIVDPLTPIADTHTQLVIPSTRTLTDIILPTLRGGRRGQ